jgi:hypothetical protein
MWSTLLTLVLTVLGFVIVLGLWYVIQMYVRYKSGCGDDRDLLEFMAHGCTGCKGPGSCSRKTTHSEHHYESL